MAAGTGLDAQVGYKAETTFGTGVVVTQFAPLVSETMKKDIDRVESAAQFAGRRVLASSQWAAGNAKVGGDIQHELYDQHFGLFFKAAFGTVTDVGTVAPYTHTFWPVTSLPSFTTQIGRPTVYGSVIPFTYTGCKIDKWAFSAKAGEIATWGMTLVAQEEARGTSLAVASYPITRPWVFTSASVSIDGTLVPVKQFDMAGDNMLASDRNFLGSTVISEPLAKDLGAYTGKLECEWGNPSAMGTLAYQRFTNGTESALVLTLASGTLSGTITANVRYDGDTPNVGDRGIVAHGIPFKCVGASTDAGALTAVLVDNDATA